MECTLLDPVPDGIQSWIRKVQLDLCELRHLAHTTNWEAQLDLCELRHLAHTTNGEVQLDLC